MMITELVNSLKVQLSERVSNPILGTFSLSWLAFNHEFIIVLFSKTTIDLKLFILREGLYSGLFAHIFYWLIAPLLSSAAIIIFYPLVSYKLYKYWHQSQKKLKEIKQKIDDEIPLTRAESRKIRGDFARLQLEYEDELKKHHDQIELLKNERDQSLADLSNEIQQNKSKRKDNDSLQDEIKKLNGQLKNDEKSKKVVATMEKYHHNIGTLENDLLIFLHKSSNAVSREMLDAKFSNSTARSTGTVLFDLCEKKFVSHNETFNSYQLLKLGEEYLVKHGLTPEATEIRN